MREALRVLPRHSRMWSKPRASSGSGGGESAARLCTGTTADTTRVEVSVFCLGDSRGRQSSFLTTSMRGAAVAVGHTILVIAYHLLSTDDGYRDLGEHDFDERDRHAVAHRRVSLPRGPWLQGDAQPSGVREDFHSGPKLGITHHSATATSEPVPRTFLPVEKKRDDKLNGVDAVPTPRIEQDSAVK